MAVLPLNLDSGPGLQMDFDGFRVNGRHESSIADCGRYGPRSNQRLIGIGQNRPIPLESLFSSSSSKLIWSSHGTSLRDMRQRAAVWK
jgi:hypothetical protein